MRPAEHPLCYEALNRPVLEHVPVSTKRVLDLGCGTGAMGRKLKEQSDLEVVGVTYSDEEAAQAIIHLDRVVVGDLNSYDLGGLGQFDCVVCSHVLEHLYVPGQLLRHLHRNLNSGATLIVALPNVLHWRQRLMFLQGSFCYTDGGIMDSTHYRFYDWATARTLLQNSGYNVFAAQAYGTFPLSRYFGAVGRWLDTISVKALPAFFGTQFVLACTSKSDQI